MVSFHEHHFCDSDGIPQTIYMRSDGYFNATKLCKSAKKEWGHYAHNLGSKGFIAELKKRNIHKHVIQTTSTGKNDDRGTWICAELAVHVAMWLSPCWAVEVSCLIASAGFRQLQAEGASKLFDHMIECVKEEGERQQDISGFIYAVTASYYLAVKMGYWSGKVADLRSRYQTLFGSEMQLVTSSVADARSEEKLLFARFEKSRIEVELFKKENWNEYVEYLNTV